MPNSSTEPQRLKASDVRQHWSEVVNKVFREKSRIIVEKSGITVGAIISEQDLARLEALDRQEQERRALLERMRAAFADVPEDALLEETVRTVRQVRAEERRTRQRADAQ
jgi:PHD/YefM family antitoxin component YafN of YafNO toxin-antitoxin module